MERPYSPRDRLGTMVSSRSRSLSDKDESFSSTELPDIGRKHVSQDNEDREGLGKDDRINNNLPSPAPSPTPCQDCGKKNQNRPWGGPTLPGKVTDRNMSSSQSTVSSGRRSAVSGLNARTGRVTSPHDRPDVDERNTITDRTLDRNSHIDKTVERNSNLERGTTLDRGPTLERGPTIDRSPTMERRNSRAMTRGGKRMSMDVNHYDKFARRGGRGHTAGTHERKPSPNRRLLNLHHSPTRVSPRLKRRGSIDPNVTLDPSNLSVNGEKTEMRANDTRPVTRGINRRGSFQHQPLGYNRRANTTVDEKVSDVPADRPPVSLGDRSSHSVNSKDTRVALPAISPPLIGARKTLDS